jgi:hypothetical protein
MKSSSKSEPAVARWRRELAESASFAGNVLALLGRRADAAAAYARAKTLLDTLVAQDPKNRQWQLHRAD